MANNQSSPRKHDSPNKSSHNSGEHRPHDERADSDRDFEDPVNEASDESFPASDPPSWTNATATKDGQ